MTAYAHDDLLNALKVAVNRNHRRRQRRTRVAIVVGVFVLLVGGTVAAATNAPWWQNAAPPVNPQVVNRQLAPQIGSDFPPAADRSRARTVSEFNGATLVAAPVGKNGYCLIPALPGHPDLGDSCEYQASDEVRDYALPASQGTARWIIYGRFTNPAAATIDMSAAVGQDLRVKLQPGGFFITDIPESRWAALDNAAGPATVLDDTGKTLATVCLDFGPSPNSAQAGQQDFPSLLDSPPCKAPVQIQSKPEIAQSRLLVEATLHYENNGLPAGSQIALWTAPDEGGGSCLLLGALNPGPPSNPTSCGANSGNPIYASGHPIIVGDSATLWHGNYDHLVEGSIDSKSGIVNVVLKLPGRSTTLTLDDGWFLGDTAPTKTLAVPDAYVVGYDASGHEVARVRVWEH